MSANETPRIADLKSGSGLPGPRANLGLLHSFARTATRAEVDECLSYLRPDLADSPEEFVVMCGVLGQCVLNRSDPAAAVSTARFFASHASWRIRESVALGLQEIAGGRMELITGLLEPWASGTPLEQRAAVAALCEPRLLKDEAVVARVLALLDRVTRPLASKTALTEDEKVLRKALGYGWSVAVAANPALGLPVFSALGRQPGKHIAWIVAENLKKQRLKRLLES